MSNNKIMSIDSLYKFFVKQNQSVNFSSKDSGKPIVVSVAGNFEASSDDIPGMLKIKLRVAHTDTNRNGSHISKENMEKAMPSLKYRPILAFIHTLPSGEEDFYAHNMEIVEDENGEEKINYLERQVGCFTADEPYFEYDKEMDKTYVIAYAVIPEEYTSAANIIRRKNGTKVSCELVINELSYNAKEKYLDLTDFYFGATSLLGCDENGNEIGEGMLGARADISDFCHKEPTFNYQYKLISILEKLNFTLESLNKQNNVTDKGGERDMGKFEELLAKYGKTTEEIPFEIEGLSDEELEAKFEEVFGDAGEVAASNEEDDTPSVSNEGDEPVATEEEACGGKKKKRCSEDNGQDDVNEDDEPIATEDEACKKKKKCSEEDEPVATEDEACKKKKRCSEDSESFVVKYELSHDDIRSALYNLLAEYSEDGYCYAWILSVYDDKFIYEDCMENKCYRQGYTKDGDTISLNDGRVEVFSEWLTKEEIDALNALKSDYAELKAFKENYDAAELKAQKEAILGKAEYECLADSADFAQLNSDMDKYSVDELSTKADLIFAAHMKSTMEFSAKDNSVKKPKTIGINFNRKEDEKSAYGNLFKKD